MVITTPLLYLQYLFEPDVSVETRDPKLAATTKKGKVIEATQHVILIMVSSQ